MPKRIIRIISLLLLPLLLCDGPWALAVGSALAPCHTPLQVSPFHHATAFTIDVLMSPNLWFHQVPVDLKLMSRLRKAGRTLGNLSGLGRFPWRIVIAPMVDGGPPLIGIVRMEGVDFSDSQSTPQEDGPDRFAHDYPDFARRIGERWIADHWPQIDAMRTSAGSGAAFLFEFGWPHLMDAYDRPGWVEGHWGDLVAMTLGSKEEAGALLGFGLPALKTQFKLLGVNMHWAEWKRIVMGSKTEAWRVLTDSIPKVREAYPGPWFAQNIEVLAGMVERERDGTPWLLERVFTANHDIIIERGLGAFSDVWTPVPQPEKKSPRLAKEVISLHFGILWYYEHYPELAVLAAAAKESEIRSGLGLAALADNHRTEFIKTRWPELSALGAEARSDAPLLFESLAAIIDHLPEKGSWKPFGIPLLGLVRAARSEESNIPAKLSESLVSLERSYERPWVVQNLPKLLTNASKAGASPVDFLGTILPSLSTIITAENLDGICQTLRRVGADQPAILYRALAVYVPVLRNLITAQNLEARSRLATALYKDTGGRSDGLPELLTVVSSGLTDENLAPVGESLKRLQRGFPKIVGQLFDRQHNDVDVMKKIVAKLGAGWVAGQLAGMSKMPDDEVAFQIHVEIPRRMAASGAERLKDEWDRLIALRLSLGVSVLCFDSIIGPKIIDRLGLEWVQAHMDMMRGIDLRQRRFDVDMAGTSDHSLGNKAGTFYVWSNLAEVIALWGVDDFRQQGPDLAKFTEAAGDTPFDGFLSLLKSDPLNIRAIIPSQDPAMPGLSWPQLVVAMPSFRYIGSSTCRMLNILMGPAETVDRDRRLVAKQLIGSRGESYYASGALGSELTAEVRSPEIRSRWEALRGMLRGHREKDDNAADYKFDEFIGLLAAFSHRALAAPDMLALGGEIDALQEAGYGLGQVKQAIQLVTHHGGDMAFWRSLQSRLLEVAAHTNKHNRQRVFQLLLGTGSNDYFYLRQIQAAKADILLHLGFYRELLEEFPRLGYGLLQGLTGGIIAGYVPMALSLEDRRHIFEYIHYMRSFAPDIYAIYRQDGLAALEPIRDLAGKIRTDEIGPQEIDAFAAHYRKNAPDEYEEVSEFAEEDNDTTEDGEPLPIAAQAVGPLATAIQSVIPTSGASFVGSGEVHGLLKTRLRQGDLRHHVPPALRNKDFGPGQGGDIVLNEWTLKPGERFDPTGRLTQIIDQLRFPDRGIDKAQAQRRREADQTALHLAIGAYVQAKNTETSQQLLEAFFKFVAHFNQLGEKVDHVVLGDYQGTLLMEQLLVDRHNLVEVLVNELETYFAAHSADRPQVPVVLTAAIRNPRSVAIALTRVWEQGQKIAANLPESFQRILHGIGLGVAREALLPLLADRDLADLVVTVIKEATPMRPETSAEMAAHLFAEPVRVVEQEKDRFHSTESDRRFSLEFRVVKGIPYGLWGLNAGVCIAPDPVLWKDPNFMLLAMMDKETGRAAGFIHLYSVLRDERRILTVPGIEPSVEFLSEVRAQDIYPLMENALIEVAKAGGYDWVFLPSDPNILSNRTEISDIVAKRVRDGRYPPATLTSPVEWNTVPEAYPFSTGHLLYQKPNPTLPSTKFVAALFAIVSVFWSWAGALHPAAVTSSHSPSMSRAA